MDQVLLETAKYAAVLRDIGLILGVPTLIAVALRLHSQHVASLQAQVDLAKGTQYDRALSIIEAQKKVFLVERELLEKSVADLQAKGAEHKDEANRLQSKIKDLNVGVDQLTKLTYNLEESLADTPEGIVVFQGLLIGKVDGIVFKTRLTDAEVKLIASDRHAMGSADRLLALLREKRRAQ